MTVPAAQPTGDSVGWVRWSLRRRDEHRLVTMLSCGALAIAAVMAVFGLPPVDLHGPLHRIGIMDPLCGGTRAARATALGHWAQAWRYNPLGILVVLTAVGAVTRALVGLILGRWLTATVAWSPNRRRIAIGIALLAVVVLTARQQLRADLLMSAAGT